MVAELNPDLLNRTHRFTLGDFTCTVYKDEEGAQSPDRLLAGIPDAERERVFAEGRHDFNNVLLSYNVLLIDTGQAGQPGQRILVDTGNGVETGGEGRLLPLLAAENIPLESIDIVIVSHAHGDHYAGLMNSAGQKNFPNAKYIMWRDEWRFYTSPERLEFERSRDQGEERLALIQKWFLPAEPYLTLVDATTAEVAPGIRLIYAPGHSKHHIAVEVESKGASLLYVADAFIHPVFLENPAWSFAVDFDHSDLAEATRRMLLARAVTTDALLIGYHFPFPGLGRVRQHGETYVWTGLEGAIS